MNVAMLMGRLTADPKCGEKNDVEYASYSLAVDRPTGRDQRETDFINCVAFGKSAVFAEKYLIKGMKICVEGKIRTGSYTNKDGNKVYTTQVVVGKHYFCESKKASEEPRESAPDDFMAVPDGVQEELPFA